MKLNVSNRKEMVFKRPRVQYFHMPPAINEVEQLDSCKPLDVILQSNLTSSSAMAERPRKA